MIISEDANGRCWFEAHSVIEDQGELFEITLPDQTVCDLVRFLPHNGPEAEFWDIAIDVGHRQVLYPQPSDSELLDAARSPED